MNDIEKLSAAFDSGQLLRPSRDELNIVDLTTAVASIAGVCGIHLTENATKVTQIIGTSEHIVFILADGLGMEFVEELPAQSFLKRHLSTELRTVFPSTTSAVLTTLATGQWPGTHAVLGWNVYIPEIDEISTIIKFIRRSDEVILTSLGVSTSTAYPVPSILPSFKRKSLSLAPESIANSPYSRYCAGGTLTRGFKTLSDAVGQTVNHIDRARRPTYTYIYWDKIDYNCHKHGRDHTSVRAAIHQLEIEIARLSADLPTNASIVLTADHGLLDANEDQTHTIKHSENWAGLLRTEPSGDKRVVQFHVRDGAQASFCKLFREKYSDRFVLLTINEAEELRLFGPEPFSAESRRRLGNLMAISLGADVISYQGPTKRENTPPKISHHSGLTPSEMRVPLIVA